jgi:hypothetical protein
MRSRERGIEPMLSLLLTQGLRVGDFLLSLGERQEAEGIHRELIESAGFARLTFMRYYGPAIRACYQIMDGQLEEAAKSHDSVLRIGVELGAPIAASNYASWSGRRLSGYLGWGLEGLKRLEERVRMAGGETVEPLSRAYYLAVWGRGRSKRPQLRLMGS